MSLFNRFFLWPLLLTGHLLAMSLLAWHLLAQVQFGYPLAYSLMNIEAHIQQYGPLNRFKGQFEQTTPEEHKAIFAEISRAVQNSGQGLADISYPLSDGRHEQLMREPEVIHLQDVANLIDRFYLTGVAGLALWLPLLVYARWQKRHLPPIKKIVLGFLSALLVLTLLTLVIGPVKVFYWLHEQIFPDDHEWFFYYQESLMTTLMKAPDLFGLISIWLLALILALWGLSLWGMQKLLQQPPNDEHKKGGSKRSAKGGNRRK
jgi:hypothetical protein